MLSLTLSAWCGAIFRSYAAGYYAVYNALTARIYCNKGCFVLVANETYTQLIKFFKYLYQPFEFNLKTITVTATTHENKLLNYQHHNIFSVI